MSMQTIKIGYLFITCRWTNRPLLTVVKAVGNIQTRQSFGSYQLHLEYRIPSNITGSGQRRDNSGVFLASTGPGDSRHELQILESYGNDTYVNGQAGSIFKQASPWLIQSANRENGRRWTLFGKSQCLLPMVL